MKNFYKSTKNLKHERFELELLVMPYLFFTENFSINFDIKLNKTVAKVPRIAIKTIKFRFKAAREKNSVKNIKQVKTELDITTNKALRILLNGEHNLNSSENPLKAVKITHRVEISV